jgi:SAM-dependent methyltransferase
MLGAARRDNMTELSIIVPVYESADSLRSLHKRLAASLNRLEVSYELIFVDDGSHDGSTEIAFELARGDERVRAVRMGRKFGEEAAIRAGLARSNARWIVVMDPDLQDAPDDISRLYGNAREGYEIVMTRRRRTGDARPRAVAERAYHAMVGALVHRPIDTEVRTFSIVSERVAHIVLANPRRRYRLLLQTLDVPRMIVEVEGPAHYRSSPYSPIGLLRQSVIGVLEEARATARPASGSRDRTSAMEDAGRSDRYHEVLGRVETDHWWLAAMRDVVVASLLATTEHGGRVLDIGCSTGHLLASVPSDYERIGLEANAGAVALARERHPDIEFVHGRAEALPFEDASFDAVLTTDVLSDGGVDDQVAVREARRVLRPGGTLIVHVAAYDQLLSGHDRAVGTGRRYRRETLERLLTSAGFVPTRVTYRMTALFPPAVLHRLLSRGSGQGDVDQVRPMVNRVLAAVMRAENAVVLKRSLPFGLSLLAVARAPVGATPTEDPGGVAPEDDEVTVS